MIYMNSAQHVYVESLRNSSISKSLARAVFSDSLNIDQVALLDKKIEDVSDQGQQVASGTNSVILH